MGIKLTRRGEEKENDSEEAYTDREGKREDAGCIEAIGRVKRLEKVGYSATSSTSRQMHINTYLTSKPE